MNQQFSSQHCPFSKMSYLQYDLLTSSDSTLAQPHQKNSSSPSFADYVHSLHDIKSPKMHRQQTIVLQKPHILPKIDPVIPELNKMQAHFVLSVNKMNSNQSMSHQLVPTPKNKGQAQMPLSINRKSLPPQKPLKLSPITSRSSYCIKTVQQLDQDDGIFLTRIGGEEVIQQIARLFHQQTSSHPLIQKIDDAQMYEQKFCTFLEYIMGKPVFFNIEALKQKHIPLQINHDQYNQFKSYLISSFIKCNRGPPELIFEFSALIEQYKYCIITSEQQFAQIFNKKTEHNIDETPESIVNLADMHYRKILDDQILNEFFIGIQMDEQAKKLGRIVHQMMGWDCSVDYVLNYLRRSHKQMKLTNVHFTLFKQCLVESMKEMGLRDDQVELITQRMDGYRSCIVNQDCLLDFYFQSPTLFKVQVKKYEILLQRDPRFRNFTNTAALLRHAHFLLKYVTHQHQPLLTRTDLKTLHKNCIIQVEWIEAFRDNFFQLIKNINLDRLILQDYADIWFQLRYTITNQCTIESIVGSNMIDAVQFKIQINLQDNEMYSDHFRNVDYQIKPHIKKIINFIFKNSQLYKANDLRVIHYPLRISEQTFSLFLQLLRTVMEEEKISIKLIQLAEQICCYYRSSICNL